MIMDQGWCASPWLIRIVEGESNGVDISGCNVVMAMFFPGPTLFDGDGTGRIYLDNGTSKDQRRELEAICTAQRGGPLEVIGALVNKSLSVRITDIEVNEDNGVTKAEVGEYGYIVSTRMVNEARDTVKLLNAGFALVWIAALTLLVLAETILPAGHLVGRATGLIMIAWGAWLISLQAG